ncbi:T9SS type A sorting domain-containing protein [Flavobacterium sp. J27]|uniref:T9SS type A sorting domain-containing protein n=1 Tax=Flavobacterium sp. J27 TaxID=2060419 RepID=UPI00102F5307|nr:T9SS type A sorting domain-containing protein [Flavobacterium sp. J27]
MIKKDFLLFLLLGNLFLLQAQTPGLIYKPSSTAFGKSVLDFNGDGFASVTTSGFATIDYGAESELQMIAIPEITSEPRLDLASGGSSGYLDIVSFNGTNSVFVLTKNVNGTNYFIVRFRLDKASTARKGYSLLIDTNNQFGSTTSSNPGFEKEIILETGVGVKINTLNVALGTITNTISYDVEERHQRTIALSTNNGDLDYFYDFFVNLDDLGISGPVRFAATTVTSTQSGVIGNLADVNGVDGINFGGNTSSMLNSLISTFPPTDLTTLVQGATFGPSITLAPVILGSINTASSTISGTSSESNGTIIKVFNGASQIGSTTVTSGTWSLTGVAGLNVGDVITAKATATSKTESISSNAKTVTGVPVCYLPEPVITSRTNGTQLINGTWSNGNPIPNATTYRIRLYALANNGLVATEFFALGGAISYVNTNGTWSFDVDAPQSTFNNSDYFAVVESATCTSDYSNASVKNGSPTTIAPTVNTNPIYAASGSQNISVTNNHGSAVKIYLYVNGKIVAPLAGTNFATGATANISVSGLLQGDIVKARAVATTGSFVLSDNSNTVKVTVNTTTLTNSPVITGSYVAGSNATVTGTSSELPGTIITLFKGSTQIGTAVVNSYGNWSISGLTLVGGDVLTAKAVADGKLISTTSNAVTVATSLPAAPTVSAPINAYATLIKGTLGQGDVTVYVDGVRLRNPTGTTVLTTTAANWNGAAGLTGYSTSEIYRGAKISATNTVSGVTSVRSAEVTVVGVASFKITNTSDGVLGNQVSGIPFNIKITAMDGLNGTGSVVTSFTGKVVLSSSTSILSGGGETLSFVNGVLASHTMTLGTIGTGIKINAINPLDPTAFGSTTLDITSSVWMGAAGSTDFAVASNWVGNAVPISGADIQFATTPLNDCILLSDKTIGSLRNASSKQFILNGNRVTVTNQLVLTGGVSDGLIDATALGSTLIMKGITAQSLDANKLVTNTLYGLEINSKSQVLLNQDTKLTGILTLTAGQLLIDTNKILTLKSNALTTAVVAPVVGGATISGIVEVERFVPAKRAFRFLSSSVTSTTTVKENWQENGVNTPGWGTHITGGGNVSANQTASGFDVTNTGNPSLFTYDNSNQIWNSVSNTSSTIAAGTPYRILVRGDRTISLATNTPTPTNTTLRVKGSLVTGNFAVTNLSAVANGYSFVGNPYQCPVDMNVVLQASTNLNKNFYYVWDPTRNVRGAYVTVDVINNINNFPSSSANKYAQSGQAFFVQTLTNGASQMLFKETDKVVNTSSSTIFRNTLDVPELKLVLYESQAFLDGGSEADALLVHFDASFSNAIDEYDAEKPINQDENFGLKNNSKTLSIERRNFPIETDELPLHVDQYRNTNYTIVATSSLDNGLYTYLYDKHTQNYTIIPSNQSAIYNYSVSATDTGSMDTDRFKIVFQNSILSTPHTELGSEFVLFPNPIDSNQGFTIKVVQPVNEALVEIYNAIGQKIFSKIIANVDGKIEVRTENSLSAGVYHVSIKTSGKTSIQKLIVK